MVLFFFSPSSFCSSFWFELTYETCIKKITIEASCSNTWKKNSFDHDGLALRMKGVMEGWEVLCPFLFVAEASPQRVSRGCREKKNLKVWLEQLCWSLQWFPFPPNLLDVSFWLVLIKTILLFKHHSPLFTFSNNSALVVSQKLTQRHSFYVCLSSLSEKGTLLGGDVLLSRTLSPDIITPLSF